MWKTTFFAMLATLVALTLSSCEVIGGIFKAGLWSGIIIVVLVIGLIVFLISKISGRR